jgi:hypothetical protein
MKARNKILGSTTVLVVCSLYASCWPAMAATVPYATDFSTDPGWATDQPANYFWDGIFQAYFVRAENISPGYFPSRYAYKLLPQAVESFNLQWDVVPVHIDWSAGIFVGLYDSTLNTGGIPGGQYIQAGPDWDDGGKHWVLYTSLGPPVASPSGTWAPGRHYTCNLSYDAGTGNIHFDVRNQGSETPFWSTDITSGPFGEVLRYLGTSRGGIGDDGTYPGLDRWAVAAGYLDNVSLSDPTSVDADGDGLTDSEEVNTYHTDPNKWDTDGDGVSDGQEVLAGTDPNSASSVFKITSVQRNPDRSLTLEWSSVSNKVYRVKRSLTPVAPEAVVLTNNLAPTPPVNRFTDMTATNRAAFYWVEVQ